MDPEDKKLLEEAVNLSRENNKMLLSLKRSMQIRRFMSFIYWIFIIGSAIGAYYFVQPYVDQAVNVYTGAKGNFESFNEFFQNLKK